MKTLIKFLAIVAVATSAYAQPKCAVYTIINTVPPGGLMDQTARDIAVTVKEVTGVSAVVEAKPSGEGVAAMAFLKTVPADGCTVGYFRSSIFQRQAMEGTESVGYDVMREFSHAAIGLKFPFLIAGSNRMPPNTYREFVQYVKNNKVSISSAGAPNDIIIDALEAIYKKPDWTRPMYKGGAPQILDLLGAHTDFYVGITVPALQYAQEGKIKAYAVTSEHRLRGYPNVPTMRELGVNRVDYGWAAVSLLSTTDPEHVAWWGEIVQKTWQKKELHVKYDQAAGIVGEDTSPATATKFLNAEMQKLRKKDK
jgi:tripartite-type tricarboxylate transporter receptor subunit TctC